MPLRVLGAALVGAALAAAGFGAAARLRKRAQALEFLQEAVRLLKLRVEQFYEPFGEAIADLAGQNPFFAALMRQPDPLTEEAWRQALAQLGLPAQDSCALLELRRAIPQAARGESAHFHAAQAQLERAYAKTRQRSDKDGPLYRKLGLLAGLGALILLL